MNVLLISEHYFPKVGGTVSYVEHTATNLAKKGLNVYLLVPALGKLKELKVANHTLPNLTLLQLGVNEKELLFNASERNILCNWMINNLLKISQQYHIEVVHLLFGLFLAEKINTQTLKENGIKTINTIHNVPPQECSKSWKEDEFLRYYTDIVRKIGVKWVNKKRIKKNAFDNYVVPSKMVKQELRKYIPSSKIKVIGHGGAEHIPTPNKPKRNNPTIQLLTVGGMVPHKNQHLIPIIAAHLKKENINFIWNIVGPTRNQRYVDAIKSTLVSLNLTTTVYLHNHATTNDLSIFYKNADMYIQLSNEEGFCMTVLDAIAYGIPTLGTPVGAIPEMLELVEGTIIENHLPTLKLTIEHYIKIIDTLTIQPNLLEKFKSTYKWSTAADQLIQLYSNDS